MVVKYYVKNYVQYTNWALFLVHETGLTHLVPYTKWELFFQKKWHVCETGHTQIWSKLSKH